MDFKTMSINDIISWCKKNKKVDWLKEEAAKTTKCKVYPRKTIINENGKKVSVADKTQKPVIQERPISFVQIKYDFCNTFMPEVIPQAKGKTPTMYDLIASL